MNSLTDKKVHKRDILDKTDPHSFESVGSILRGLLQGRRAPMITVTRFQPFVSRRGRDTVVRLSFDYNADLVADLKILIRKYETHVLNPDARCAGGWLPKSKCWFIEESIWPAVKNDLIEFGYSINEFVNKAVNS
jgi:hypothetical protein